MDLLLQAAKVLELENSGIVSDRALGRTTRGPNVHTSPKNKGDTKNVNRIRTFSGSPLFFDDSSGTIDDDVGFGGERRRAGGSGTREVHNQLEKNRRKQMREFFNQLQQCIPSLENKRVATHSILQGAIKHIKNLKKKDVEQEREIQMLARKKSDLKKKYDTEFNKCSGDQQRKITEVRLQMEKADSRGAFGDDEEEDDDDDEDGHASDSTSTASEGPGDEDELCDEDKAGTSEKSNVSRVNPVVAAKLDGFRKRKLATLDLYPKSTDYIIASMKDAGYLSGTSSKQKPTASVSSSSVALKNMLEQKKRQQSGFVPSIAAGSHSILEQVRPKVLVTACAATTKAPSSKGMSSLTSSHPMISNQLASAMSIPLVNPNPTMLVGPADHSLTSSNLSPLKNRTPAVLSLSNLHSKIRLGEPDINPQPIMSNHSLANSVISSATAQDGPNPKRFMRTNSSSSGMSEGTHDEKSRAHVPFSNASKSPSSVFAGTANAFSESPAAKSKSNSRFTGTPPNHASTSSVLHMSQPVSPASNHSNKQMMPTVFPLSLIQGLALNHAVATPMAVTTAAVTPSNPGGTSGPVSLNSAASLPLLSAISPILQPKIHPSTEIFIASPIKNDSSALAPSSGTNPSGVSRVTTLLAATASPPNGGVIKSNPTAFLGTLPMTINNNGLSSSINSIVTLAAPTIQGAGGTAVALPDSLKTMSLAPTLLPFTVATGPPLSHAAHPAASSNSISPGTPLRFFAPLNPGSVMASPLTNGQASLMPAVVQLDGSGQVTVLPNFVQLQTSQMLGQPAVVMVTAPNSIISPMTSATGGQVSATSHHSSSSSGSLL